MTVRSPAGGPGSTPPGTLAGPRPAAGRRPTPTTGVLVHAGFFLTGVATVLLGPAIPELAAHWQVAPGRLAPLFTAQFLTSSLGSIVSSHRPWRSLQVAYPAMAAGLLGLALGGPGLAVASAALLGLGLGLGIPASNLLVAAANRHRRGAALAILNLLWGAGAVACPLVFAGLRGRVSAAAVLLGLHGAVVLLAVALLVAGRAPAAGAGSTAADEGAGAPPAHPATLALFAAMLFLYVGAESAVGGWLVALADQVGGATAASMLVHSAFWGSLLGGRFLAPLILRRVPEPTLFGLSVVVAGGGLGALLVAGSRSAVAVAAAICGLGMAALFPLTVSALTAVTEGGGSGRVGWVFAFGGVGGAVLPWLVPEVAAPASLQPGFAVPLAAVILLGVLLAVHQTLLARRAAAGGRGAADRAAGKTAVPGGPAPRRRGH